MKKFIDSEGFKSFLTLLKSKLDRDTKKTSDELDKLYTALGWTDKNETFTNYLSAIEFDTTDLISTLQVMNSYLGKSYAQAGTDTAFARIKKLEDASAAAGSLTENLAQNKDIDYLFDLYVNHDASTISTEDKNAIITTAYGSADNKPNYLD